jgi:RNA polymerase sigma-70 factor (ECF subfamily)
MNSPADENSLRKWRQGDGEAFGDLFESHSSRLYTLAYRLTGRTEDARDLLQETALKAFTSSARCQQAAAFYGWIRRILMNQFLDNLRHWNRAGRESIDNRADWSEIEKRSPAGDTPNPRAVLEQREQAMELESALLSLEPHYRIVLILREIEGLSYSEMAAELQVPVETVRTRLRRGRSLMRESMSATGLAV